MRNVLSIDVEDYFHVNNFSCLIPRCSWDQFESRVERNMLKVLECLAAKRVKGTFFVLGWVAERFPEIVRDIYSDGHEVACHGYSHQLVYQQSREEFRCETRRAKRLLEEITGRQVVSYRAATYSITRESSWALEILAEEGFQNDSSIFPIVHDHYGVPNAPRAPVRLKLMNGLELVEFPMSTLRWFGLNWPIAGGGYFRLIPYQVTKAAFHHLNHVEKLPVIFYLHPWEFDPEQPIQKAGMLSRWRHYLNLDKTLPRFERLLSDFQFVPLTELSTRQEYPQVSVGEVMGLDLSSPLASTPNALGRETQP